MRREEVGKMKRREKGKRMGRMAQSGILSKREREPGKGDGGKGRWG
jgi:hypothetical protein